jgi:hypothetical protein
VFYSEKTEALSPVSSDPDNGYAASETGESVRSTAVESVSLSSNREHSTPRARGMASGIIHGDAPLPTRREAGPDTPLGRKNKRDFGHQALW